MDEPKDNLLTQLTITKPTLTEKLVNQIKEHIAQMQEKHLPNNTDGNVSGSSSKSNHAAEEANYGLEDQLTNQKLRQLEQIFEEADEDGGGGLDMDEFRNAMREAMGDHLTDEELDRLFMKVDTNCDGTVDWDEYLSYMLLEFREKDAMNFVNQLKPLPQTIQMVPNMNQYQRHHDYIIRIVRVPNGIKLQHNIFRPLWDKMGKYVSVTKDGILNFWTMNLTHLKRHKLPAPKTFNKQIGLWVTSLTVMPNMNLLCVGSTAGTLIFYDYTAYRFTPTLTLTNLDICITCISYWIDPKSTHHSILLFGDTRGNIMAIEFDECRSMCFLQPLSKNFKPIVSFKELMKGETCGVKAYKLPGVHQDSVIDINYNPALHNTFLSCCRRHDTALFMGDIEAKKSSYFPVNKGVNSFQYCIRANIIVTGGKDALVRVWNPYVPSKPIMILHGQKSPILFVFVHEKEEHIISISQEKDIVIFDMTTQTAIQSIGRKYITMGQRILSAACFNVHRKALLLGSNQLAIMEHQVRDIESQTLFSHNKPVNKVEYNELFDQLVSGGSDSLVCVWDANTGERVMQFAAHKVLQKGGGEIEIEITSMSFDPTLRRLITAARDGSVKVWNFNNGALLRTLEIRHPGEITGIVCPKQRIITAGWNRVISVYVDSYDDETVTVWDQRHREDITAIACKTPSTVVSGSYDGDILIWSLETGHVTIRFNSHISIKPCTMLDIVHGSFLDLPDVSTKSEDKEKDDVGESEDAAKDEFDIATWMAYNTHRASIAAPIPFMTRRQSKATRKKAVFMNNRKGGSGNERVMRPMLPTITSGTNLLGIPTGRQFNINVNNNNIPIHDVNSEIPEKYVMLPPLNSSSNFDFTRPLIVTEEIKKEGKFPQGPRFCPDNERFKKQFGNKKKRDALVKSIIKTNKSKKEPEQNLNMNNNLQSPAEEDTLSASHERLFAKLGRQMPQNMSNPFEEARSKANYTENKRYKYDAYLRKNEASVEKLLLLNTRQSDQVTATLIAVTTGGWIRFWSIDHNGGLLGQFNAGHNPGDSVQALCVDTKEYYLITGDSTGYIKVWDIKEYCTAKGLGYMMHDSEEKKARYAMFPLMTNDQCKLREKHVRQSRHRPPPEITEPNSTWIPPPLLNSFRGHLQAITDITYIPRGERIATASTDCSIRLWTIYGEFIGICGQETPWQWSLKIQPEERIAETEAVTVPLTDISDLPIKKKTLFERGGTKAKRVLPADIRRVASATTLRVLYGGVRPYWRLAKNILMVWVPLLSLSRKKQMEEEEEASTYQETERKAYSMETVDKTPITSAILGHTYKQIMKHQPIPELVKIRQFQAQCDVYGSLPLYDLAQIEEKDTPQVILEMQERQRNLMNTVRGDPKSKVSRGLRRLKVMRMISFNKDSSQTSVENASVARQPSANRQRALPRINSGATVANETLVQPTVKISAATAPIKQIRK